MLWELVGIVVVVCGEMCGKVYGKICGRKTLGPHSSSPSDIFNMSNQVTSKSSISFYGTTLIRCFS